MKLTRKPLILRVVVVTFAVSLLGAYVVYSQIRAKPRAASSTKSAAMVQTRLSTHRQAARQPLSSKAEVVPQPPAEPEVSMPGSKLGLVFSGSRPLFGSDSIGDGDLVAEDGTIIVGTKSGPVFPVSKLPRPEWLGIDWPDSNSSTIQAPANLWRIEPEITKQQELNPVIAPGSKDLVPVIPPNWVAPTAKLEKPAARAIAPGSKSKVPLIQVQPPANNPVKQEAAR